MHAASLESFTAPRIHPTAMRFGSPSAFLVPTAPPRHWNFGFTGDWKPLGPPPRLEARYSVGVARTPSHLEAARELMRARYEWRGYATDAAQDEPAGVTLIASELGRVAATVTVGGDTPGGLAVESLYSEEVAKLRKDGARLCEFTRLAVDGAGDSLKLLGALFHVAYLCARRQHKATHLLVEVNPRHVRFYMRMLGFRVAGPQRTCQRVDAPAVMLSLSLDHAEDQIATYGGRPELAQTNRSLYPYFFAAYAEDSIYARLAGTEPTGYRWGRPAPLAA
ncbi:MAG TPA: hypothetical protein PK359_23235 [Burkholderiaceae bacterium]|nr:hypothetical protein [Burkholderiaceae bacterium]